MLLESSTSELKKKHPDRTFFSCAVAPTNTSKFYNAIVVFYKNEYFTSGSSAHGNYFGDCIVYGRRRSDDVCDPLGHVDEFYQGSSTYFSMLEKGKLSLLNGVSKTIVELGTFSEISKSMRQAFRIMSPEIARGKITIDKIRSISNNYDELLNKKSDLIFVIYDKSMGVVSMKTGEEILPCIFSRIHVEDNKLRGELLLCYIGDRRFELNVKDLNTKSLYNMKKYIFESIFLNN